MVWEVSKMCKREQERAKAVELMKFTAHVQRIRRAPLALLPSTR